MVTLRSGRSGHRTIAWPDSVSTAWREHESRPTESTSLLDSPPISASLKQVLAPEIVNGRELAGMVHNAPEGDEMYRVQRDIADWRKRVHGFLRDHDPALAEWFSVEDHPQYGDNIVSRMIVGYAGGEERLSLLNYMNQRIGKLDRILAGDQP